MWIKVTDRLPEDKQRCLIWDRNCHCSYNGKKETIVHVYSA
jgi:hypothetical protein